MSKTCILCAILVLVFCQRGSEVLADQEHEHHYEAVGGDRTPRADGAVAGSLGLMFPDLIPFVDEARPYLANWQLRGDTLRIQSVFGNIGDGVFEIRRSENRPVNGRFDVFQRVYDSSDPFGVPTDFFANTAVYHGGHGHIHFEDMTDFDLLELTITDGMLGVGERVAGVAKVSSNLHDITSLGRTRRWGDFSGLPSFESGNAGLRQIVSVGHGDVYNFGTDGQSFSVAGVPKGFYWLRQTVDPRDVIRETDETNNAFEILIDLNRPGRASLAADGSFIRPGDSPTLVAPLFNGIVGDINQDGLVVGDGSGPIETDDVAAFIAGWLTTGHVGVYEMITHGDLNLNGLTDLGDWTILNTAHPELGEAIVESLLARNAPEPATALLLVYGLLLGTAVRRRTQAKRK